MIEALLDLLFPPKCPFCQRVLNRREEGLCPVCQRELPWLEGKRGLRGLEFTAGCVSPLTYQGAVRQAVHRFKFQNRTGYAGIFGRLTAQSAADIWPEERFDAVTWAPLSKKRLRERGYDQAGLLARSVGKALSLPVEETLVKVRHTPAQSGQENDGMRKANVLGAYELRPGAAVAGKRLLLVDDVVTTGSTLSECARILRTAGAEKVSCAALAQARK